MGPLGRNKPPDQLHVEKYPLAALAVELHPANVPVAIGVSWYENFDNPQQGSDGIWRIGAGNLGSVRGGHCFCLKPPALSDSPVWWRFYNQGEEGACEGFGHSRILTLLYRKTFDAFWLYDDARRVEHAYPDGEGSTNRSAAAAMKKWGVHFAGGVELVRTPWRRGAPGVETAAYRWATSASEVMTVLGETSEEVTFLNSWGQDYPHEVRMPAAVLDRLLSEEGEADVLTTK